MNVDLGIWDNLRRLVVLLLFAASLVAVVVWYLPLVKLNERERQQIMQKTILVRQEEDHARQLDNAIRALRTDPRAFERLAREKLGFVKPGETRIQFEPAPASAPGQR